MGNQLELFRMPPPGPAGGQQHHVILAGHVVGYTLRRDRRRLALRIDERGLAVGAPRAYPLAEIEAFIHSHADWVLEKIEALVNRSARRHLPIHEGTSLPVLGDTIRIRIVAGNNRGLWQTGELWLAARPQADLAAIARRALQRRALEYFRPQLSAMAEQLGQPMPALALSSARTRWGSCSAKSGIRLNWRLIHLPPRLIDYVIAHEAAHLIEMNHGPSFWHHVATLCPDWRTVRDELKRLGPGLPLI